MIESPECPAPQELCQVLLGGYGTLMYVTMYLPVGGYEIPLFMGEMAPLRTPKVRWPYPPRVCHVSCFKLPLVTFCLSLVHMCGLGLCPFTSRLVCDVLLTS